MIAGREVFDSSLVDSIVTLFNTETTDNIEVWRSEPTGQIARLNSSPKSILKPPFALDVLFSPNLDLLLKLEAAFGAFSDFLVCENACATSDAYKIKPLILQDQNSSRDSFLKVVNTGTIGKFVSRWGMKEMTYLGDKYLFPVVKREEFESEFTNTYFRKAITPKLVIKSLTLLDACIDLDGSMVPGKSTLVVVSDDLQRLKLASALINSRLFIFFIAEKYSASSYNQGITFTKAMINNMPLPKISAAEQTPFIELVDRILELKKSGGDTTELENRIDQMVYTLYDLTPDEIAIIEGN